MDKEELKKILTKASSLQKGKELATAKEFLAVEDKINAIDTKVEATNTSVGGKLDKIIEDIATPVTQLVSFKDTEITTIRGKDGKNGVNGESGQRGDKGDKGENGADGINGKDGIDGVDGVDGINGLDGKDGADGKDGKDGSSDTAKQIIDKLNSLEESIDLKIIKGSKTLVRQENLDRAVSILDSRTSFLINKINNLPSGSGTGTFSVAGGSTDNAIVRFDGTTGLLGQNSGVTIDDNNNITTAGVIVSGAGLVSAVSYGRTTNAGTGIYFPSAVQMAFAANGTQRGLISASGFDATGRVTATTIVSAGLGTAAVPSHVFTGHTDSGLWYDTSQGYVAMSVNAKLTVWFGNDGLVELFNAGGFNSILDPLNLTAERHMYLPDVQGIFTVNGGIPSVDNAVARWDGTSGALTQPSGLILSDAGTKNAILDISLIATADKTFTVPNATGTFAMTVGHARATGQTSANTNILTYTVGGADATFQVMANILVTTSTLHSIGVTVDYTDEGNTARTLTIPFAQLAGTLITAITNGTGAGPYEGVDLVIRAKAATNIVFKTAGTFTTITYNVDASILQIATT